MRDVWRASELAVARSTTMATGFAALNKELPDAGWPRSALVELLVQQHGIGEMQLLKPVLSKLSSKQRIALVPPICRTRWLAAPGTSMRTASFLTSGALRI
jgi:protein ImuA